MSSDKIPIEQLGPKAAYQRGYVAGQRRTERELANSIDKLAGRVERIASGQPTRRERVFLSILNGLLADSRNNSWTIDNKTIRKSTDYVELASRITNEALKKL